MSIQFMHKHNLTRIINYDLPTKPFPPRSLDAHTRISLITKLDADVLQAQLIDSLSLSIPYLFQATKSTHITQKGKEDLLLIGNEKVSHTEFTLYEKYKKDHMIAQ